MHAPKEIASALLLARLPKGSDMHTDWAGRVEHVADRAVLAACVHALQHDEERPLPLGVEHVLQAVDLGRIGGGSFFGGGLVTVAQAVARIAVGEPELAAGLHKDVVWKRHRRGSDAGAIRAAKAL